MHDVLRIAAESLEWRRVDDEIVILNTKTSRYLSLNRTAAVLWPLVRDAAGEEELARALMSRYGLEREQAEKDVAVFVRELADHGVLEPEHRDPAQR